MTESIIRSRTNPLVKRLRALKERGAGSAERGARWHGGGFLDGLWAVMHMQRDFSNRHFQA
jgi:hypothetical protein